MAKAKSKFKHWEWEAKTDAEKIARAEAKRDKAKHEAKIARLEASIVGNTKATTEDDLARV